MKVLVTKESYDFKGELIKTGEQDLPEKLAKAFINAGWAKPLESEVDKKPSAKDIVKLISEAQSLDEIEQYKEDERQSVSKAYEEKVAELTPDSE